MNKKNGKSHKKYNSFLLFCVEVLQQLWMAGIKEKLQEKERWRWWDEVFWHVEANSYTEKFNKYVKS